MNADVDALDVHILNNALGNICFLASQGPWGLGGIGRPNSIHSLTMNPYGVRLRQLLAQTGGEDITIYLIISGHLSCQNCVCFRLPNLLITVL